MTIELLLSLFGAVGVLCAAAWAMLKILASQYDKHNRERFAALDKSREQSQERWRDQIVALERTREEAARVSQDRLTKLENKYEKLDAEVRKILTDVPREYVARTDYVRRESVIEGKIDNLYLRIENWMIRGKNA